jgi:hypothetical protein
MSRNIRLASFVLVLLFALGCGKGLSRSAAKAAIEKYLQAKPVIESLQLEEVTSQVEGYHQKACWKILGLRDLVSEPKLVNTRPMQYGPSWSRSSITYYTYTVEPLKPENVVEIKVGQNPNSVFSTEEVRRATVRLANRKLLSIEAIGEPANIPTGQLVSWVDFIYEETGTGFFEPQCGHSSYRQPKVGPQRGRAGFALYDTGWKLEQIDL